MDNFNRQSRFFSDSISFTKKTVINSINNHNKYSKASSISCFDLSTLCTKIPHSKMIKMLNELIELCFKGVDKNLISVNIHGAKCTDNSVAFRKFSLKNGY